MTLKILEFGGRPCTMVGQVSKKGRHGPYVLVHVRYLDGKDPKDGHVTRGRFERAKRIMGNQALVWARVDQLIQQGMEPERASQQAMAELTKGILTNGF